LISKQLLLQSAIKLFCLNSYSSNLQMKKGNYLATIAGNIIIAGTYKFECVSGPQYAFKMAGVQYFMMSLWSVPDKETREYMEKFYTYWLSGTPIRQAIQTTKQEMRSEYPKVAYIWAAFVLVE